MNRENADGLIMTMWANDPKWSFVRFDENHEIIEVVEKEVVSNGATVRIYNYKHGKDFVRVAEQMIAKNFLVKKPMECMDWEHLLTSNSLKNNDKKRSGFLSDNH